jgi:hypothetical protein
MALFKTVFKDGESKVVQMSPEEEAAILAEWLLPHTPPETDPIDNLRIAMKVDPTLLDKIKAK